MIAVFKHELRSHFHSLTAYVFGAFLLAFVGIWAMQYNLQSAVSNFEYVLGDSSLIFAVLVPILTMRVIAEERRIYKGVSANVDFYSGFVYSMLDLPLELYTPMFAIARIVGWSAHRLEELINVDKIIRPAYKNISVQHEYMPLSDR